MDVRADPIPISALEHFAYCQGQWALIHLEQIFDDPGHAVRVGIYRLHAQSDGITRRLGSRPAFDQREPYVL